MDENSSAVEETESTYSEEIEKANAPFLEKDKAEETQDTEVPTQEEEQEEVETGEGQAVDPEIEKKAAEAKVQELRQIEIDVHSLYNLAQHSQNFTQNPKFHMGSYIRIIGFLDKLGATQAPPPPAPQNRAAKRRDQKEIDKGLKNVQKAMDNINDASTK